MAIEIELKYSLTPEMLQKFSQHPLLSKYAKSPSETYRLLSIYYDTADFDLLHLGYVLRIREYQGKYIQTIKSMNNLSSNELHQRHEWHLEVQNGMPYLNDFPDKNIIDFLTTHHIQTKIKPIFTTDFIRTAWHLFPNKNIEIECAIDQGKVKTDAGASEICEVEFELMTGEIGDLYKLAKEFSKDILWLPEKISKAEKGFKLLRVKV